MKLTGGDILHGMPPLREQLLCDLLRGLEGGARGHDGAEEREDRLLAPFARSVKRGYNQSAQLSK